MEMQTLGDPPPPRPIVTLEELRKAIRPSGLTKPLLALTKRMARLSAGMGQKPPGADLATRRARCAELNERATMLAKSGELSAEQGPLLDMLLHRYAMVHFQ